MYNLTYTYKGIPFFFRPYDSRIKLIFLRRGIAFTHDISYPQTNITRHTFRTWCANHRGDYIQVDITEDVRHVSWNTVNLQISFRRTVLPKPSPNPAFLRPVL